MSAWGTWQAENGEIHVVPCDEQKNVVGGHEQSMHCFCNPVRGETDSRVIVHFDPERGGFNA